MQNKNSPWLQPYKLNTKERKRVVEAYKNGKNLHQIAKQFGISPPSVKKYLKLKNIKIRKVIPNLRYTVDSDFFRKIDTEAKAYFLGLLYADGCVRKHKTQESYLVQLMLLQADESILKKFKKSIKYTGPITYNLNEAGSKIAALRFRKKALYLDLIRQGCMPRKTFKLKFPTENQVPSYLLNHFIRGYFDGDGCLYINKKYKVGRFYFISTKSFCKNFAKFIKAELNINCSLEDIPILKGKKSFSIIKRSVVGGNIICSKIMKWIYKDSNIYLQRKKNKYKEYLILLREKGKLKYFKNRPTNYTF